MSYDILYNKQFIRVDENRVIPIIEMGSNNCYEASGSGRKRARDWGNSYGFTNGKMIINEDELLTNIDKVREDEIKRSDERFAKDGDESWKYEDKRFGWHTSIALFGKGTSGTSFSAFKSFYKTGIKQALTIEQLKEFGVTFTINLYRYKDTDITDKGFEIKPSVTFESTKHMIDTINEFEAYYGAKFSFYLSMNGEWNIRNIRETRKRVKKVKERKDVDEVFVLECDGGYFVRNTRSGYRYSYYLCGSTKKFLTEKEANRFHNKMRNKDRFTVKRLETQTTLYV